MNSTVRKWVLFGLVQLVCVAPVVGSEVDVYLTARRCDPSGCLDGVLTFSSLGLPLDFVEIPEAIFGLATDGRDLYVAVDDVIEQYSTSGQHLRTVATLPSVITHLQRGPNGDFYASSSFDDAVYRFDDDGNILTTIPDVTGVFGVNADTSGRIYVSAGDDLFIYDEDGNLQDTVQAPFPFGSDIAIDHDANLLYHFGQPGMFSTYDISGNSPILQSTLPVTSESFHAFFDPVTGNLFYSGVAAGRQVTTDTATAVGFPYATGGFFVGGIVAIPVPEPAAPVALLVVSLGWLLHRQRSGQ